MNTAPPVNTEQERREFLLAAERLIQTRENERERWGRMWVKAVRASFKFDPRRCSAEGFLKTVWGYDRLDEIRSEGSRRRRRGRPVVTVSCTFDPACGFEPVAADGPQESREDLGARARKALARMPGSVAEACALSARGVQYATIGLLQGIPAATAKSRIDRGRQLVRFMAEAGAAA